jgi:hypothetical protein
MGAGAQDALRLCEFGPGEGKERQRVSLLPRSGLRSQESLLLGRWWAPSSGQYLRTHPQFLAWACPRGCLELVLLPAQPGPDLRVSLPHLPSRPWDAPQETAKRREVAQPEPSNARRLDGEYDTAA